MAVGIQATTWLSPGRVDLQVMGVYQARPAYVSSHGIRTKQLKNLLVHG